MDHEFERHDVPAMTRAADRMDSLAETADLMGDADGAMQWRHRAAELRIRAMSLLDD